MNIFEYLAAQHSIIERGKSKTVQEITDGAAEVNNAYIMVPQATGLLVLLLDFIIINFRSKPQFSRSILLKSYSYRPSCCNSNRLISSSKHKLRDAKRCN